MHLIREEKAVASSILLRIWLKLEHAKCMCVKARRPTFLPGLCPAECVIWATAQYQRGGSATYLSCDRPTANCRLHIFEGSGNTEIGEQMPCRVNRG